LDVAVFSTSCAMFYFPGFPIDFGPARVRFWSGRLDALNDAVLGRLNPSALIVELGIYLYGMDDLGRGRNCSFSMLDDGLERGANRQTAACIEASGMDMAIDGSVVRESVLAGEFFRALPAEKILVNGGMVWMPANIALNAVIVELGAVGAGGWAGTAGVLRIGLAGVLVLGHRCDRAPSFRRESVGQNVLSWFYYNMVNSVGQGEIWSTAKPFE
jgi:hypothetical protein